jgi:2-oxoglutarate ferredoxin oxidoreductase subunit beta
MPTYVDFNTLHATHGRALPFATGIKLAKPELTIIAIMGDGDATAIGGNHFIHAARRNIDLNAIIINNQVYGMTGGQHSPATPYGSRSTTSPYGHIEHAFDIAQVAVSAGADFVARSTVYHAQLLEELIERALKKPGFSVVEAVSNCHVQFGRRNGRGDAVAMMTWQRDHAVRIERARQMDAKDMEDKFTIGILADSDTPIYTDAYQKIRDLSKDATGENP